MYTSQQTAYKPQVDTRVNARPEQIDFSALLDPALLQAARNIYRTYYEVHPDLVQRPIGVAIDRFTHRGKLIFAGKPILLPQECFVPLSQVESDLY
ncbi:hypothetical protein ACQ4M4_17610 [Leptolyngbya sp. AN02str]|uniref:hypothetical protein n=1 Tax=Leptolyngbya sp. AN02str TaxID=3423363 RepID=UPI003D3231F3